MADVMAHSNMPAKIAIKPRVGLTAKPHLPLSIAIAVIFGERVSGRGDKNHRD